MTFNPRVVTERDDEIGAGLLQAGEASGAGDFDAALADLRVRNLLQAAVFGDEIDRWRLGRLIAEAVCR